MVTFLVIYWVVATVLIGASLGGLIWAASQDGQRPRSSEQPR